jgi:hypothetical protein
VPEAWVGIVDDETVRLCLSSWAQTVRLALLLVAIGIAGLAARYRVG